MSQNLYEGQGNSKPRFYFETEGAGLLERAARAEDNPQTAAKIDAQQAADKRWFEDNPSRTLYLRRARAWERLDDFSNVTIVAKITPDIRVRVPLNLRNKPIDKTLAEWIEMWNGEEEALADALARDPCGRGEMVAKLRKSPLAGSKGSL